MASELSCTLPLGADGSATRLCDAVKAQLGADVPAGLELVVTVARPNRLQAMLRSGTGSAVKNGPELEVSIVDSDSFPDGILASFAKSLIDSLK